ncbi:MAG: hypothetical protein IJA54_00125 [Tyzzerella sp.]|nr:hypothetical protein [Tyzzerella sp.]
MESYQKENISTLQHEDSYKSMRNEELERIIKIPVYRPDTIPALKESHLRMIQIISDLTKTVANLEKRVAFLEEKTLKKAGRKKQTYNFDGKELTDDYLVYLIDYDLATIGKLEKIVGAGKNVLRNRYNKAKKKHQLERQVKKNDNT